MMAGDGVEEVHLEIRQLLRQLGQGDDERVLRRLARALPVHFAQEEQYGGFFDRLRSRVRDRREIDRLEAEHNEILEQLLAVQPGDAEAVQALVRRMADHEWNESRLAASLQSGPRLGL